MLVARKENKEQKIRNIQLVFTMLLIINNKEKKLKGNVKNKPNIRYKFFLNFFF